MPTDLRELTLRDIINPLTIDKLLSFSLLKNMEKNIEYRKFKLDCQDVIMYIDHVYVMNNNFAESFVFSWEEIHAGMSKYGHHWLKDTNS